MLLEGRMSNLGDMLSQAEIDALLNGTPSANSTKTDFFGGTGNPSNSLSPQEIDALGEIGNICMGTSATTLFTLLGQKVLITTPNVTVTNWDEMSKQYALPVVAVQVEYTDGLIGSNLLIMREDDVKVITDLMMGGEGNNISGDLTDLHLSAISEAMNQMVGSSATSMSSMFDKKIDISPPRASIIRFESEPPLKGFDAEQQIVKIAFKIVVGTLIDSEIMQLIPIKFAKDLVRILLNSDGGGNSEPVPSYSAPPPQQYSQPVQQQPPPIYQEQNYSQPPQQQDYYGGQMPQGFEMNEPPPKNRAPVNVQPAHFQSFDESRVLNERKNISLIMDVPLQVTVELGRTNRLIKDVLEFGPGSIIELDKLAGEPVDILVNGKAIAKGEVVVIDESFGVRITDIIHPSKRL
jgi:flagellar motor switch protein FliN/FliY